MSQTFLYDAPAADLPSLSPYPKRVRTYPHWARMIPLLIFLFVVDGADKPIKGALVTCDGFTNYNRDDGSTSDDPMESDSRGAVVLTSAGAVTTICYVAKVGYQPWSGSVVMSEASLWTVLRLKKKARGPQSTSSIPARSRSLPIAQTRPNPQAGVARSQFRTDAPLVHRRQDARRVRREALARTADTSREWRRLATRTADTVGRMSYKRQLAGLDTGCAVNCATALPSIGGFASSKGLYPRLVFPYGCVSFHAAVAERILA